MELFFSKLPLKKLHQKALNHTPNSSNILPKLSDPSAQTFASSDHSFFTCTKKPQKIQEAAAYLVRVTAPNFNYPSGFLNLCLAALQERLPRPSN